MDMENELAKRDIEIDALQVELHNCEPLLLAKDQHTLGSLLSWCVVMYDCTGSKGH